MHDGRIKKMAMTELHKTMRIADLKILTKVLSVIALLSAIVIGGVVFSSLAMKSIDDGYGDLISRISKATIENTRAGSSLRLFIANVYSLDFETTDAGNTQMLAAIQKNQVEYEARLKAVKSLAPEFSDQIAVANTAALSAFERCAPSIKRAVSSTTRDDIYDVGMDIKTSCDPLVTQAIEKQSELTNTLIAYADKEDAALTFKTNSTITTNIISMAVGLVMAMIVAYVVATKGIVSPLERLALVMKRLADNDLTVSIDDQDRKDEVGAMARTVEVFKDNALERHRMEEQERASVEAREKRAKTIEVLTSSFENLMRGMLESVGSATSQLDSTAQAMGENAEQTKRQVTNVASATNQASANVQTVASAAEELSASIRDIINQVEQSTRLSQAAAAEAAASNETVQGLAESSNRIGEVVSLINDIASQTNLLALNATIEAARAGDAGKGFAVVANEVKNLANQTARATDEISQQISAVQARTGEAVSAIAAIINRIQEINQISEAIAQSVDGQSAATNEIARNAGQAAQGTHEVSQAIVGVNNSASETGVAAKQVQSASETLVQQAEGLEREVLSFLKGVSAA